MTSNLIDKLSKLDAPDREVDGEIWRYLMSDESRAVLYGPVPKLTASVDAAIALAARVLPGHQWSAGFSRHVPHNAQIWAPSGSGYYEGESDDNRAIALCIAILRAKDASHDL